MVPGRAPRLLVLVHCGSERTLEPVRQDGSFAEKRQSYRAHLFLVVAVAQSSVRRG
jgi:hypothetical protein